MDLKPKTKAEMANEYGICCRTFYRWLKKEKIEIPRGLLKPNQVEIIYKAFGCPKKS
jgi:hypothetical protein